MLARRFEKWHVFGTLARNNGMLARFWHVGTHARMARNLGNSLQNVAQDFFNFI